jgi:hypothetical protein
LIVAALCSMSSLIASPYAATDARVSSYFGGLYVGATFGFFGSSVGGHGRIPGHGDRLADVHRPDLFFHELAAEHEVLLQRVLDGLGDHAVLDDGRELGEGGSKNGRIGGVRHGGLLGVLLL